ncbi:DNA polymerase III, epsilon subunit [Desulforamulus reducens MI-1]|uniref:3'-5' exonuclease DinG n=1 Tax=Desulforamulus reducens (strain ATCC BAA-1160 / DSM 100696 / MI-1) TaxID=349161 RepID=A4J5B5_DESRM|nr:helicase C-terminal domain-containing protein [Desulforamulus reducens]ABO50268.1 DNA polymerase III, epsilon subunit [Desulforamulus reducens MI-1]
MLNFVALDLETSGLDCLQDEIIEIGLVKMVDGKEIDSFSTLIRPKGILPVKIKRLTGIKDHELQDAPKLQEVLPVILQFIADLPLVGHNVKFDYDFLSTAVQSPLANPLYDTLELSKYLMPGASNHRLGYLCSYLGIDIPNQHRALDDARGAAMLLIHLLNQCEEMEPELIWQLSQFLSKSGSLWHSVLETLSSRMIKMFPDRKITATIPGATEEDSNQSERIPQPKTTLDFEQCLAVLGPEGILATTLPRFRYRSQQCDMMEQVTKGLNGDKTVLVEAGTGTGKSLAYLVPAIAWAKQNHERVLISTHTINLQEQLWNKDIPLLAKLPEYEFKSAIMKGRGNYICLRRWHSFMKEDNHTPDEAAFLAKILIWIYQTNTGDKGELVLNYSDFEYWYRVCSESDGCLGNRCQYFKEKCYFMAAKRKAERADIVIVNHSLLLSDANADNMILPSYGPLIIDEAHHLENCATDHLGRAVTRVGVLRWLAVATKLLSKLEKIAFLTIDGRWEKLLLQSSETKQRTREAATSFFEMALSWIKSIDRNGEGRCSMRFDRGGNIDGIPSIPVAVDAELDNLLVNLRTLCQALVKISDQLEEGTVITGGGPGIIRDLAAWASVGQELSDNLEWICRHQEESQVYWVEGGGDSPEVVFRSAPIDVGPLLYEKLFSENRPVVLTSATLSVDGNFKHYINSVGLDFLPQENILEKHLNSPFNYNEQAILCVARDILPPGQVSNKEYHDELSKAIFHISMAAEGRSLVLFTSHRSLRETYQRLKDQYENEDICLLGHELDGSRRRLVEQFMEGRRTVLFGASSFWEGVDIPGEALSCVIIVKLPFAPPNHPVTEARLQKLSRQGRNGFMEHQIPQAVIKFKQGFGRLIRGPEDRGVVVVLDGRLVEKRYGYKFFNSLPIAQHIRDSWLGISKKARFWLTTGK